MLLRGNRTHFNPTAQWAVGREGLTERNLNFRIAEMQIDSRTGLPTKLSDTHPGAASDCQRTWLLGSPYGGAVMRQHD